MSTASTHSCLAVGLPRIPNPSDFPVPKHMWPLDLLTDNAPNGHFVRNLLVFGGLGRGGCVSKGFVFEAPDFSNAATSELNAFQDQISILLAALGENQRLQIQWYCDSDYQRELLRYREETQRATNPWSRRCRNERFVRYWRAMEDRKLRRQRLAIYVSRRVESGPVFDASRAELTTHYNHLLDQLEREFAQVHELLVY